MLRRAGQTWHFVARQYLENKRQVTVGEMAAALGISSKRAGNLLRSLGWRRELRYDYKGNTSITVYHGHYINDEKSKEVEQLENANKNCQRQGGI